MPFKFRIVFSGICAFVPDPDGSFDEPAHRTGFFDSVTVVLQNLRRARAVGDRNARDSHLARLELKSGQGWVSSGRLPDLIAPRIGKDVYTLNNERVSFKFNGAAVTPDKIEILNFGKKPDPAPEEPRPRTSEHRFFWWVPKMERVAAGSDRIHARLLEDSNDVSGWVKFDRGLFSTEELSRRVMVFKPIDGGDVILRQRIARSIAVEVEEVESVEIQIEKTGEPTSTLRLSGVAEEEVTIEIKNRELDHLLNDRIDTPPPTTDQPDIDFSTYYEMASVPAPVAILPHEPGVEGEAPAPGIASDTPASILGLSIGGVCPPAAFSGAALEAESEAPMETRRVDALESKAAMRKQTRR